MAVPKKRAANTSRKGKVKMSACQRNPSNNGSRSELKKAQDYCWWVGVASNQKNAKNAGG